MDLADHYNNLWEESIVKFNRHEFELDPFLQAEPDNRLGISLIARPSIQVRENINLFLRELKLSEPHQYYYPPSDMHVTILTIKSCHTGFRLSDINPQDYVGLLKEIIPKIKRFTIDFTGVTASPASIMIQGFPQDNNLDLLRNKIRNKIKNSHLLQSIDQRYSLKTAHSTVVRFRVPLTQPQSFIFKLKEFRNFPFGSTCVDKVALVCNDWYQRKESVKVIHHFLLR